MKNIEVLEYALYAIAGIYLVAFVVIVVEYVLDVLLAVI